MATLLRPLNRPLHLPNRNPLTASSSLFAFAPPSRRLPRPSYPPRPPRLRDRFPRRRKNLASSFPARQFSPPRRPRPRPRRRNVPRDSSTARIPIFPSVPSSLVTNQPRRRPSRARRRRRRRPLPPPLRSSLLPTRPSALLLPRSPRSRSPPRSRRRRRRPSAVSTSPTSPAPFCSPIQSRRPSTPLSFLLHHVVSSFHGRRTLKDQKP
mmetsp:Transcript_7083/g.21368  ORF Transcript_7083/g.21368 Transcript_7083/m.21368 type:complete len:209 (+) Transcript_7083:3116-3742(+)